MALLVHDKQMMDDVKRGIVSTEELTNYLIRTYPVTQLARELAEIMLNENQLGTKPIIYLTESEVKKLYDLKIDNESLANVRDAFIVQASTGLAYIDVLNLKREDIHITEDGTHYINKLRHKTSNSFTTVVLPMGVEVLKKHDYQLHIISNQKYNLFLKTLQSLTGITTTLTTHVARRTYATTLVNRGCPIQTVSKALGHASVKVTQSAYAQILNRTVINDIKKIL